MSKLSIYETAWIDLVFEDRNKEYGAYQLRRDNPKTTVKSLFIGLLLITTLATLPTIINYFSGTTTVPTIPDAISVALSEIVYPPKPIIKTKTDVAPLPPSDPAPRQTTMTNPVVTESSDANNEVPENKDIQSNATNNSESGTGIPNNIPKSGSENGGGTTGETETININPVPIASLDKMPEYPGGIDNFYKYVGRNFKTPEDELASGTMIRVVVSFVIEKDGSMTDISVIRNPGYGLDKEAIRVLKSLKVKWTPGKIAGQAVRTSYNLPIAVKAP